MLNNPSNTTEDANFSTVFTGIANETKAGVTRPMDLVALQETDMVSVSRIRNLLGSNFTSHITCTFDDCVGFVYNTQTLSLIPGSLTSLTGLGFTRAPLRAEFRPVGTSGDADFYAYSVHLKAGTSGSDEARRETESIALRADVDALGDGEHVLVFGDFNFQGSSNEDAWPHLVASGNGRLNDPINRPGNWNNNFSFRDVHTQNPQDDPNGGYMDDRFDLILATDEAISAGGLRYLPNSYRAYGNNGTHSLNGPITSGSGASPAILTALSLASDHLPVVMDLEFSSVPGSLTIAESGGSTNAIEGGGTDDFTVVLDTVPSANVSVQVTPDSQVDLGAGPGTPVFLFFSPSTALTPQPVTVAAVDDMIAEGNHVGTISFATTSSDSNYSGVVTPDVNVNITDNDVAFSIAQDPIEVLAGTGTVTIELQLTGPAAIDAFTYAIGIGDGMGGGGTGVAPSFTAPGALLNGVAGWTQNGNLPTPQIAFGNVNAPFGTGQTAALPEAVLALTIDTSQSVAGDSWPINVNVNGFSNASLSGSAFETVAENATLSFVAAGAVVDRHLFYNNSFYDGNGTAVSAADFAAIDVSKSAYIAGSGPATFANYSGYSQGINGIFIDIADLGTTPTADDFEFAVGNDNTPAGWNVLTVEPAIERFNGAGTGGSDRVALTWPDNAIPTDQWLEVNVLSTGPNSIVGVTDVFYFGNSIGETGVGTTRVDSSDAGAIAANFTGFFDPAESVDFAFDINKSSRIDSVDAGIVAANFDGFTDVPIALINIGVTSSASSDSTLAAFFGPTGQPSFGGSPSFALRSAPASPTKPTSLQPELGELGTRNPETQSAASPIHVPLELDAKKEETAIALDAALLQLLDEPAVSTQLLDVPT